MRSASRSLRRRAALAAGAAALLAGPVALWRRAALATPAPSVLLQDRHGRYLGEVGGADGEPLGFWPLPTVPARVRAAVLAAEDRRFDRHPGVDPWALGRAALQNWRSGRRVSGASTLAMQVARLQSPGPRTWPRKVLEAATAVVLTLRHGREAVLAQWLRLAPFGNRGHGLGYAARRYLDKPPEDLSWAECALLVALPQAPGRMNPWEPDGRRRALARAQRILDGLLASGALPEGEGRLARAQLAELYLPERGATPPAALHPLLRLRERYADPGVRSALPSPLVRATLDLDLQAALERSARAAVSAARGPASLNAAVMVVDPTSGDVLGALGSTGYGDRVAAGSIDYSRVQRSPGSTLKPFVYALALERGVIGPATVLDDLGRGPDGIANADDRFLGPLLPRAALATSRNVPAAELLALVGLEAGYEFVGRLGLHQGAEAARYFGAGLALGTLPVTLETLVGAYTCLAGEGLQTDLRWTCEGAPPARRRALSCATARRVALYLSDPMARLPVFPRMGNLEYPFPVAVKTGTSSRYRDSWAVAWSRRWLVAAWMGDPGFRSVEGLTGCAGAAGLVREVLTSLHPGQGAGLDDLALPPPEGTSPVRLCSMTGALATAACDRWLVEPLAPGEVPADECVAHLRLASGGGGTTPLLDLPARYARWAREEGLPAAPGADGAEPTVSVVAPEDGLRLFRCPDTPPARSTLALEATVDAGASQVVWYVDGAPFRVVEAPFVARWPLAPGEHVFEARLPGAARGSRRVRVLVE